MKGNCHYDECMTCAHCLGLNKGDIVERLGDDGVMYEYEIHYIEPDGDCVYIYNINANPVSAEIFADECKLVRSCYE